MKNFFRGSFILLFSFTCFAWSAQLQSQQTTSPVAPIQNRVAPVSPFAQIQAYRKSGQLDAAKELAINYLSKQPNDSDVMLLLGLIYYQQKNYPQAEVYLHKVLAIAPNYLDAKLGLIRIKIAQGQYQDAAGLIAQARIQAANDPQLKVVEEALKSAQNEQPATPLPPKVAVLKQQAITVPVAPLQQIQQLRQKGQLSAAKAVAENYLHQKPNDVDVMLLLGLIYYQEKNYVQAEFYLNKVLAITPKYLDATLGIIRIKIAQGKYQDAAKLLSQARAQSAANSGVKELENMLNKIQKQSVQVKKPATVPVKNKPSEFEIINSYFKAGNLCYAKMLALKHLATHPSDGDVRVILGQIYLKQKCYQQAKNEFLYVLQYYPKYVDARLFLADIALHYGDDILAMNIINQGLLCDPCNVDLLAKKAHIVFVQHMYAQSAFRAQKILAIAPCNENARNVLQEIKKVSPRYTYGLNEIGISSGNDDVPDLGEIWDYSSFYYSADTAAGNVAAKVNYAARLGIRAPQMELDFSPVINQNLYFELTGAYANQPTLFPTYAASAEGYLATHSIFDISLGSKYSYITDSTFFTRYTGSLSKYIGDYWLSFRPYYFVPNAGQRSILYTGVIRRYFGTTDRYLNLSLGFGKSPDLADLQTLDFLVIKNKYANFGGEFPICNHRFVIDLGIGYQRWNYPSGLVRNLYGMNAGVKYRF